jgi:hypothetical protein
MAKSASGGAVTLKTTVAECDREPLAHVTITRFGPAVAKVHVRVDFPGPASLVGLSEHDALLLVRSIIPIKWFSVVTVIVEFASEFTWLKDVAGFALIEKSPT